MIRGGQSASIEASLSDQSELVVKDVLGGERTLKGSDIPKLKMWYQSGSLRLEWTERNDKKIQGTVLRFQGSGFKFSFVQASTSS
jgi:hypothetical protein